MVTHVPEHGMNLRNDVGHGTAHAGALTPERILLIWLFMVRLTLIRAITDEDDVDGGDARVNEAPGEAAPLDSE